jgi:putative MATE family efflux protein
MSEAMGRESIGRLLLRFSGPAVVSMLVGASYNVVDAIFVGRLGPEALAALAIAFPLMLIFMAIGQGTGVGVASVISRRLGAGDPEGANRVAGVAIALSLIIGVLITIVCFPILEPLLRLFRASGPVLPLAKRYVSVLIAFQFLNPFLMVLGSIIRAEGRPILSSTGMIVSAIINIALDPILIFGLGPIPAMGVAGAATATVIGRGIGGLVFIVYLVSGRTSYRFRPGYFLPRLRILIEIYRVGVASMARMSAQALVMALANGVATSFGVIPLAAIGVILRCARFAFMVCMGIGQGMLPLVGYNFGAKQKQRVGEVVIKAGLVSLAWATLCWLVLILFPTQVMSLFNNDPEFLHEAVHALRIFVLLFFAVGIQGIATFFFQGIGKGFPSLILATARQVIFLSPALLILPRIFGLIGLWAAFPVADALSIVLTLAWTSIEFRRQGIRFSFRAS